MSLPFSSATIEEFENWFYASLKETVNARGEAGHTTKSGGAPLLDDVLRWSARESLSTLKL